MFSNPFKDFFYFVKADRRALYAIFCIAVFCAGVVCVVNSIDRGVDASDMVQVEDAIRNGRLRDENVGNDYGSKVAHASLHVFDPNEVDSLTLVSFGIRAYKVKNFLRYRAAGKVFFSSDDLGDTYGWTQEDVDLLAPYVRIDKAKVNKICEERNKRKHYGKEFQDKKHSAGKSTDAGKYSNGDDSYNADLGSSQSYREKGSGYGREYAKKQGGRAAGDASPHGGYAPKFEHLTVVDVNAADSATLRRIPGVGEKTCRAIIRYRERLGGIRDVGQLLEVKLVSPDMLKWFEVKDGFELRKIKVNTASFHVLNSHPYIRYEQAKDLMNYIRLYGHIKDEGVLMSTGIFSMDEVKILGPYIDYGK